MTCKHCGTALPDDARFCGNCGSNVSPADLAATQEQPALNTNSQEVQPPATESAPAPAVQSAETPVAAQTTANTGAASAWVQPDQQPAATTDNTGAIPAQAPIAAAQSPEAAPQVPAATPQAPVDQPQAVPYNAEQPQNTAPGFIPAGGQPVAAAPLPAKKPFNKKILIAIIAAIVVLAGAIFGVVMLVKGASPKSVVSGAWTKTQDAYSSAQANTEKALGLEGFSDWVSKDPTHQSFSFKLTGINEDMEYYLDEEMVGFGFKLDTYLDKDKQQLAVEGDLNLGSYAAFSAILRADGDILALALPQFYEGFLAVNTSTLGEDLEDSFFGSSGMFGNLSAEEFSFSLFGATSSANWYNNLMTEESKEKIQKEYETFLNKFVYEEVGKENIKLNSGKVDVKKYTATITAAELEIFTNNVIDILKEDTVFCALLENSSSVNYYSYEDESAEEQLTELQELFSDTFSNLDDIVVNYYIQDGYLVALNTEIVLYDDPLTIDAQFGTKDNIGEYFYVSLASRDTSMSFEFTGNSIDSNGLYTATGSIVVEDSYYEESTNIGFEVEWDTKSTSDNFSATFTGTVDDEEYKIVLAGDAEAKSKSYLTLDLHDSSLYYKDWYDDENEASFEIFYSVEPLGNYKFEEFTPQYVLEMTETELQKLVEEIMENLYNIA
ncbi:MAG: zinc-ribbon domain-containing protein [Oscillospiraceae bacterium]